VTSVLGADGADGVDGVSIPPGGADSERFHPPHRGKAFRLILLEGLISLGFWP